MNQAIQFKSTDTVKSAPMNSPLSDKVCPVSVAPYLDNPIRRFLTGTRKIARTYLSPGMTVLDVGCGPAPMLMDILHAIGPEGHVICTDIQQGMLDRVAHKAKRKGVEQQVRLHLCTPDSLGLDAAIADFAVAFWMVHEAPHPARLVEQILKTLKPGGKFLLIEPSMHVKDAEFRSVVTHCLEQGAEFCPQPRIRLSRAALFSI